MDRTHGETIAAKQLAATPQVDMLVGDIYGDRDYTSIGLAANTIASSFGKVVSSGKKLQDFHPGDISLALCRMISYNIA